MRVPGNTRQGGTVRLAALAALAVTAMALSAAVLARTGEIRPYDSAASACERLGGSWSGGIAFGPSHGEIGFRGQAGPIRFEGRARRFSGCLRFDGRPEASAAVLEVPAEALTTGIALRDRHMAAALQSGLYPVVRFEYGAGSLRVSPELPGASSGERGQGWVWGSIDGTLELSGSRRAQGVTIRWRLPGSYLEVEGEATVSLAAYGISAPRFLWLQVDDAVRVHFALRVPLRESVATM